MVGICGIDSFAKLQFCILIYLVETLELLPNALRCQLCIKIKTMQAAEADLGEGSGDAHPDPPEMKPSSSYSTLRKVP